MLATKSHRARAMNTYRRAAETGDLGKIWGKLKYRGLVRRHVVALGQPIVERLGIHWNICVDDERLVEVGSNAKYAPKTMVCWKLVGVLLLLYGGGLVEALELRTDDSSEWIGVGDAYAEVGGLQNLGQAEVLYLWGRKDASPTIELNCHAARNGRRRLNRGGSGHL